MATDTGGGADREMEGLSDIIQEGSPIVWDVNGESYACIYVKSGGTVKLGKSKLPMESIIGCSYGTVFETSEDGMELVRTTRPRVLEWEAGPAAALSDKNNSDLVADTNNQRLGEADIDAMKASGKGGEEIIHALTQNSSTWDGKTEFAQDKYRKKKARKYLSFATARRPTARTLCQAFFSKSPARIFNLRPDSLAILLSSANIGANTRTLVVEACNGLLLGAVLERMGGCGTACCGHLTPTPRLEHTRLFGLPPSWLACARACPLAALRQAAAAAAQPPPQPSCDPAAGQGAETVPAEQCRADAPAGAAAASLADTPAEAAAASPADAPADAPAEAAASSPADAPADLQAEAAAGSLNGTGGTKGGSGAAPSKAEKPRRKGVATATPEEVAQLAERRFSSCLVVYPGHDAPPLVAGLLPLLRPSASLAVFSPWLQPLAELAHHLQDAKLAVAIQVAESWLRRLQVLPGRTHPDMTMSGTGGYVLSATVVDRTPSAAAVSKSPPRKRPRAGGTRGRARR